MSNDAWRPTRCSAGKVEEGARHIHEQFINSLTDDLLHGAFGTYKLHCFTRRTKIASEVRKGSRSTQERATYASNYFHEILRVSLG